MNSQDHGLKDHMKTLDTVHCRGVSLSIMAATSANWREICCEILIKRLRHPFACCDAATLEYSPGTAVEIFVTFLTGPQLQRMHETEGAYFLTELKQVKLHLGLSLEAFRHATLTFSCISSHVRFG